MVLKPFKKLFDSIFAEKFEEIPPPEHELIIYLCLTTSILVVHQEVFSWLSTDAFLTILK